MSTIAIISDDPSSRQTVRTALAEVGHAVLEYDKSMLELPLEGADVVCMSVANETDARVLDRLLAADAERPVIIIGQRDAVSDGVVRGAYDFVAQPANKLALQRCVAHAVEKCQLTRKVQRLSSQLEAQNASEVIPLRDLERDAIARALQATKGSVTKAAKLLGIGRATLYRRLASPDMAELRPRRGFTAHAAPVLAKGNGAALHAMSDAR